VVVAVEESCLPQRVLPDPGDVTHSLYLGDGRPGELTVTYCRTDYYDFMVELTR